PPRGGPASVVLPAVSSAPGGHGPATSISPVRHPLCLGGCLRCSQASQLHRGASMTPATPKAAKAETVAAAPTRRRRSGLRAQAEKRSRLRDEAHREKQTVDAEQRERSGDGDPRGFLSHLSIKPLWFLLAFVGGGLVMLIPIDPSIE